MPDRLRNVVLSEIKAYPKTGSGAIDWGNLGTWDEDGAKIVLARIMAGLQARRMLSPGDPNRPGDNFPVTVQNWIADNVYKYDKAGTDNGLGGDYDFALIRMSQIIYEFMDRPDILTNDAIWRMLWQRLPTQISSAMPLDGGTGASSLVGLEGVYSIYLGNGFSPSSVIVKDDSYFTTVTRYELVPGYYETVPGHNEYVPGHYGDIPGHYEWVDGVYTWIPTHNGWIEGGYQWVDATQVYHPATSEWKSYSILVEGKKFEAPYVGNSTHKMMNSIFAVGSYPETENHVLMTNGWAYLMNQMLEKNYRNDPRIASLYSANPSSYQNSGSALEDVLLSALGRIVQRGFFETNGRAYQSFTVAAIMTLYSYADASTPSGAKIKAAAKNALDYASAMFAFQSFESKRYAPSRRNISYIDHYGLYENEYSSTLFGVLSGVHSYNDDPACNSGYCGFEGGQPRAFGLFSASARYCIPDPVLDFMVRRGVLNSGNGFWARMQARFCDAHYNKGSWPRYAVDPTLNPPTNRHGDPDLTSCPVEAAPELYFGTADYLNSAGGAYNHFPALAGAVGFEKTNVYDYFTKYSTIIPKGNVNWTGLADAQTRVVMGGQGWDGDNIGTYKNFTYLPVSLSTLPSDLTRTNYFSVGAATIGLYTAPAGSPSGLEKQILVLGTFQGKSFWEIVPKSQYSPGDVQNILSSSGNFFPASGNAYYTLVVSGEKLTLSGSFGISAYWHRPILEIDGSESKAKAQQVDFTSQAEMDAFPLIDVQEVDSKYRSTGRRFVYSTGDGRIVIDNPQVGKLTLDSWNYKNPQSTYRPYGTLIPVLSMLLQ
jgi:hypothetical protein